ncbi:MAG: hypothetical protein DRN01_06280 [Thermoplasmata archaeon]|nr:MAG: hypothetical protein DRN01_06280 [Thermoplasmata archaeon]
MKTIMIVDEDRDIVERIKSYLEKEDFNVSIAQTNREALEALEKNEQNVDVILLHSTVPGSDEDVFTPIVTNTKTKIVSIDKPLSRTCTEEELKEFIKKIM